jgi:uncharacterized membrane protein
MKTGLMALHPDEPPLHWQGLRFLIAALLGLCLMANVALARPSSTAEMDQKPSISLKSPSQDGAGALIGSTASKARRGAVPQQASSRAEAQSLDGAGALKLDEQFFVGKVIDVTPLHVNDKLLQATGMMSRQQLVTVEITEGPYKNLKAKVLNEITDNPAFNVEVAPGKEVILSVVGGGEKVPEINIADYHRAPVLAWLLVVFLVVFMIFGGRTGLKSLAGLAVSVILIVLVLLPLSLQGVYPLATAAGICLIATLTTMLFVAGFSKKAGAAIIGTIGGVIIAGLAAHIVIASAPLTGLSSEEAQILRGSVLALRPGFYSGLLAAGMLIGALGVIMDVGISVASSVQEIAKANRKLSAAQLYASGMNVGRDIMGTMTNTLILAYTGGALPLLLLASLMPLGKLINLDIFATEIAAALCGSLGLVCTIPLTALAAAVLMARQTVDDKEILKGLAPLENSGNSAPVKSLD